MSPRKIAWIGLRLSEASSLALNRSNNFSCSLSAVAIGASGAASATGSGDMIGATATGWVAQPASTASDAEIRSARAFIGKSPQGPEDEPRKKGAADRPQRPFY